MDDYRKLSREWGSKAKKEQSRAKKCNLKKIDGEDEICGPPRQQKKDTKKWCRGKIGREHEGECKMYDELKQANHGPRDYGYMSRCRVLICKKCGKHLESWWGSKKDKPDWVIK